MQKESAAEIELNLKKKARRRLVGAIALVVVMMLILPFVLQDRESLTSEEQVKITMADEVVRMPSSHLTPVAPSGFDSSIVPVDAVTNGTSVDLPKPEERLPVTDVKSAPTDEPMAQPVPDTTITPKTVETTPAPKELAPLVPQTTTDSNADTNKQKDKSNQTNDKKGTFFVQVGIFSDPENVKRLQAKLAELGYPSKTEKINTPKGEKIRLKTQTFSSRNEAATALEAIKNADLPGMVVSQ